MAASCLFRLALAPILAAAPGAAQQLNGPITVSSSVCNSIAHVNDAPGIAYTAGGDARGKALPPPAIPGGNTPLNQAVASAAIKITVPLQKGVWTPAEAQPFHREA